MYSAINFTSLRTAKKVRITQCIRLTADQFNYSNQLVVHRTSTSVFLPALINGIHPKDRERSNNNANSNSACGRGETWLSW